MKQDLKQMYGSTPESFKHRVAFALKETEEKPMKHTMRTILITAMILLLLTAVAYAAFSSQVAAFFGRAYGNDFGEWLGKGDVAAVEQSHTIDDIVFTLDEVVYRNNGLYCVGTIRPQEGSSTVIIAEDHTPDEPIGYDIHGESGYAEEAPDGTPTIAEAAAKQNGKIKMVYTRLEEIGVDGGDMLAPGCTGYSLVPQRDASIQFSIEASDAFGLEAGETYTLLLWSCTYEMNPDGELVQDSRHGENWTVEIHPVPMNDETAEPASVEVVTAQSIGDVKLIVPEEYTQTETMPVYTAAAQDFGANLQPELFNPSGIAKTENYLITYNDGAQLSWSPETLFYNEYSGSYNSNYKDPTLKPSLVPKKTLRHAAADLAGNVRSGWPDETVWADITLSQASLSAITLDDAKAKLEALLEVLNVNGYICTYALDMNIERIQSMGAVMNQMIEENQYWNPPIMDYSLVTEQDEGYYLYYENGVRTDGDRFAIQAYVTADGIANLMIRDLYRKGEIASTPASLIAPEAIMAALPLAMADSQFGDMKLDSILSLELTYTPARAENKADGMVLTPAWYVIYRDDEAAKYDYDCFAIFNAVDGDLISATFL